jgi:hypothetical protein
VTAERRGDQGMNERKGERESHPEAEGTGPEGYEREMKRDLSKTNFEGKMRNGELNVHEARKEG